MCLTNQLQMNFSLKERSGQLRNCWDTFRIHWPNQALFLQFVTTESVYYSLLGSQSKLHKLLFFHVFISALDFVLNKLCSLLCHFLIFILILYYFIHNFSSNTAGKWVYLCSFRCNWHFRYACAMKLKARTNLF